MDFEKAYQKFINGTATEEETEFVRSEMKKANDVNNILTSVKSEGATSTALRDTVKKAMKRYWRKDTLKILIIVLSSMLVLAIGATAAIGIPILTAAQDNMNYTVDEAKAIAIEHIADAYPEAKGEIEVYRVERELDVEGRIRHARYVYIFDVYNGVDNVIEIEIDSKTGKIIDVD